MTGSQQVEHIIATKKFPRSFDDYFNYVFFIAPIGFFGIGGSALSAYFRFDGSSTLFVVGLTICFLGAASGYLFLQRFRDNRTFKTIPYFSNKAIDEVEEKLQQQFSLHSCSVDKKLNIITACTKTTAFSWGEELTLILDGDFLLVNSRPLGNQPLTIFKDRQNIKKLEQIFSA